MRRRTGTLSEVCEPRSYDLISRAIEVASLAHDGIVDRNGRPYIMHALGVAMDGKSDDEFIVGMLHDVFEHSNDRVTAEHLLEWGFPMQVVHCVNLLTKQRSGKITQSWDDYIEGLITNPITLRVKLYDIEHNMESLRSSMSSNEDTVRMERYVVTRERLLMLLDLKD